MDKEVQDAIKKVKDREQRFKDDLWALINESDLKFGAIYLILRGIIETLQWKINQ
jgi:hypothetical protein